MSAYEFIRIQQNQLDVAHIGQIASQLGVFAVWRRELEKNWL